MIPTATLEHLHTLWKSNPTLSAAAVQRRLVGLATLTGDSVLAPEGWDVKRRGSPRKKAGSAEEQKLSPTE